MSIGIVGAGSVGSGIATLLARAGIAARIVNRRGPAALGPLVAGLAPQITMAPREEVLASDIVFLAVPWGRLQEALAGVDDWGGRILVDATNPLDNFRPVDLGGLTSSEAVAKLAPGARVVKAFNHLLPHVLAGDPAAEGGRRVLFYAGDDGDAKGAIANIITRTGFYGVDLGPLREGGRLLEYPGGPLPAHNFVCFD
jgi:predicted dinucleotide-binding enzyme